MKKKEHFIAFTLVELIVAVTILIILSTIWFIWYRSQLSTIRDANRISNLSSISEWLEMYRTKYSLPLPEDNIEIKSNGTLIARQWYAWAGVLSAINFTDIWKDPKDDIYYSYYLTQNQSYFQLMWFLEEEASLKTVQIDLLNKVNAEDIDYSERFPTLDWSMLGILTWTWENLNIPVQELVTWSIDVSTTTTEYTSNFSDDNNITWSWKILKTLDVIANSWWKTFRSCKEILDNLLTAWDWTYLIDLNWNSTIVYCDMTNDWGGWTLLYNQKIVAWEWYFTSKLEASNYNENNPWINTEKYSILNKTSYFSINEVFEFRLHYPNENKTNIWKQTLNPFTTHEPTNNYTVPGYNAEYEWARIDFGNITSPDTVTSTYKRWWGIAQSDNSSSLIDWCTHDSYRYNSIWTIDAWNWGFPWYGSDAVTHSNLFVR